MSNQGNNSGGTAASSAIAATLFVLPVHGAGADIAPQANPLPSPRIVVEHRASHGGLQGNCGFDFRGAMPTLMANPVVRVAALRLDRQLADFFGFGHGIRFVFEELVNPDDSEREPLLYAIAILSDERDDALLDKFILEEWSSQPAEIRKAICIGREFI